MVRNPNAPMPLKKFVANLTEFLDLGNIASSIERIFEPDLMGGWRIQGEVDAAQRIAWRLAARAKVESGLDPEIAIRARTGDSDNPGERFVELTVSYTRRSSMTHAPEIIRHSPVFDELGMDTHAYQIVVDGAVEAVKFWFFEGFDIDDPSRIAPEYSRWTGTTVGLEEGASVVQGIMTKGEWLIDQIRIANHLTADWASVVMEQTGEGTVQVWDNGNTLRVAVVGEVAGIPIGYPGRVHVTFPDSSHAAEGVRQLVEKWGTSVDRDGRQTLWFEIEKDHNPSKSDPWLSLIPTELSEPIRARLEAEFVEMDPIIDAGLRGFTMIGYDPALIRRQADKTAAVDEIYNEHRRKLVWALRRGVLDDLAIRIIAASFVFKYPMKMWNDLLPFINATAKRAGRIRHGLSILSNNEVLDSLGGVRNSPISTQLQDGTTIVLSPFDAQEDLLGILAPGIQVDPIGNSIRYYKRYIDAGGRVKCSEITGLSTGRDDYLDLTVSPVGRYWTDSLIDTRTFAEKVREGRASGETKRVLLDSIEPVPRESPLYGIADWVELVTYSNHLRAIELTIYDELPKNAFLFGLAFARAFGAYVPDYFLDGDSRIILEYIPGSEQREHTTLNNRLGRADDAMLWNRIGSLPSAQIQGMVDAILGVPLRPGSENWGDIDGAKIYGLYYRDIFGDEYGGGGLSWIYTQMSGGERTWNQFTHSLSDLEDRERRVLEAREELERINPEWYRLALQNLTELKSRATEYPNLNMLNIDDAVRFLFREKNKILRELGINYVPNILEQRQRDKFFGDLRSMHAGDPINLDLIDILENVVNMERAGIVRRRTGLYVVPHARTGVGGIPPGLDDQADVLDLPNRRRRRRQGDSPIAPIHGFGVEVLPTVTAFGEGNPVSPDGAPHTEPPKTAESEGKNESTDRTAGNEWPRTPWSDSPVPARDVQVTDVLDLPKRKYRRPWMPGRARGVPDQSMALHNDPDDPIGTPWSTNVPAVPAPEIVRALRRALAEADEMVAAALEAARDLQVDTDGLLRQAVPEISRAIRNLEGRQRDRFEAILRRSVFDRLAVRVISDEPIVAEVRPQFEHLRPHIKSVRAYVSKVRKALEVLAAQEVIKANGAVPAAPGIGVIPGKRVIVVSPLSGQRDLLDRLVPGLRQQAAQDGMSVEYLRLMVDHNGRLTATPVTGIHHGKEAGIEFYTDPDQIAWMKNLVDERTFAERLAEAEAAGERSRELLKGDLGDGTMSERVEKIIYNNGFIAVEKKVRTVEQAHAEWLGRRTLADVGAHAPNMIQLSELSFIMEFIPGVLANATAESRRRDAWPIFFDTPSAKRLGLGDALIRPWDRHEGANWMLVDGFRVFGIDGSMAYQTLEPPGGFSSHYVEYIEGDGSNFLPHTIPAEELDRIADRVKESQSEYRRLGELIWFCEVWSILQQIRQNVPADLEERRLTADGAVAYLESVRDGLAESFMVDPPHSGRTREQWTELFAGLRAEYAASATSSARDFRDLDHLEGVVKLLRDVRLKNLDIENVDRLMPGIMEKFGDEAKESIVAEVEKRIDEYLLALRERLDDLNEAVGFTNPQTVSDEEWDARFGAAVQKYEVPPETKGDAPSHGRESGGDSGSSNPDPGIESYHSFDYRAALDLPGTPWNSLPNPKDR
ncbi:hypothetical protein GCM10027167_00010 [Nocardia heshunensis]